MRVGVIRGDLPGPLNLSDLEVVSQHNPAIEPKGQERYLSRPTVARIEAVLASATTGAGAVIEGSDISGNFPITINGTNDDLKVKTSSAAAYTTVLIAQAAYANITTLLAAVNAALVGTGITARQGGGIGTRVALESNTKGVNSYLQIDSTGGGSVANTPLGLGASSVTRTMPSGAAFITALNPINGTLNVSNTAINGVGAGTNATAMAFIPTARGTHAALADVIAPRLAETPLVLEAFLYGSLAKLRSSSFNPDSRRNPPLANGAAIAVVADDGSTAFTLTVPTISSSSVSSGIITIGGTGFGSSERIETSVKISGLVNKTLDQRRIVAAGGSVSPTSIVIPASLTGGAVATTSKVQVQVRQRVSGISTLT